jgi:DNA-directed RNA polymerase subunit M/transcription elongation factor TFIIS
VPKYRYKCNECNKTLFAYHHISDELKDCESCSAKNSLIRMPSLFRTEKKNFSQTSTGNRVKKAIEEFQDDLKQEKENLREVMWEDDQ